ncbi:hypothetical protein ACYCIW_24210, partial [Klebsiella pneumoniae]
SRADKPTPRRVPPQGAVNRAGWRYARPLSIPGVLTKLLIIRANIDRAHISRDNPFVNLRVSIRTSPGK